MSSATDEVTTTEVEKFDEFYDKDIEKDREEVLTAWGVKQEEPSLFEKNETSSSPPKGILNDVTITDSIPHDSINENGTVVQDQGHDEDDKQRQNCELIPTEPIPFSPKTTSGPTTTTNLKTNTSSFSTQRDSLYPNPPSPEGMDVRSYNSQRPSITPGELESTIGSLVNTLQCLVCLETALKPPIFQCPEGHLLCQDCNQGMKECPKCSKPLENARNIRAEEIAEKLKVIQDREENLLQGHDEMPNKTIDIIIPEYQSIKQGWSKVLSYKIDITILEDGSMSPQEYCVTRTHENIASLHAFLLHEYRNNGIIVPPPPPKSIPKAPAFLIEKQKMEAAGTDNPNKDNIMVEDITLKRRCLAMTRYLKRLAKHPIISRNKVFLAFIQEKELPQQLKVPITSTFENVIESLTVLKSRLAYKEIDPWYQTKSAQLEEMDSNLRRLRKCLKQMSDLKVKSFTNSTFFRKHTVGLFSGRLFKERDLGYVINQGMECHKLVSAIHQDQSAADDLIEQLSFDYLLLVEAAQDILTRRKILQHKVQKKRASKEVKENVENITEDVFDKEGVGKDVNGSTAKVFSPTKELEDLEVKFDTMSQVIRKELEHFDSMMVDEFQKEFSAYNSNYFNLIDRSRADTSLSMMQEPSMIGQADIS